MHEQNRLLGQCSTGSTIWSTRGRKESGHRCNFQSLLGVARLVAVTMLLAASLNVLCCQVAKVVAKFVNPRRIKMRARHRAGGNKTQPRVSLAERSGVWWPWLTTVLERLECGDSVSRVCGKQSAHLHKCVHRDGHQKNFTFL